MAYHSVYVHIPFCKQRCNYCDFLSHVQSRYPEESKGYKNLLLMELGLELQALDAKKEPLGLLESVYFGGGTPTTLPAKDLIAVLQALQKNFSVDGDLEVTVETNPALADFDYLQALVEAGFNRLSMGAQSFCDQELTAMGRLHKGTDILKTVELAKQAGFANIGVDLIYGLPAQNLENWHSNLKAAIALGVNHISLYGLQVDNNSPWGQAYANHKLKVAEEDLAYEMFDLAIETLESSGFRQYEIANFALESPFYDFSSRHNQGYWHRQDYLGLGLGAASCLGAHRWQTVGTLQEYGARLQAGLTPLQEQEHLSHQQVLSEVIFLGLRLREGLNLDFVQSVYGVDITRLYQQNLEKLLSLDLVRLQKKTIGTFLQLTKKGLFLANQVFLEFLP